MRHEDDRIVDTPTALGKSYTVASTRLATLPDVTGERSVVHLLETKDARDEAIANAQEHSGAFHVLRGCHEACPIAVGDYDPDGDADNDRVEITIDDQPASGSLAISDGAVVHIDSVAIEEITVSDAVHERIEPVESAYWNEGRWNIDVYAEP